MIKDKNKINIKFVENWKREISNISKEKKDMLCNGINYKYKKEATIRDLLLFLDEKFHNLNGHDSIMYANKNELEICLKFNYKIVYKKQLLSLFDLNIPIEWIKEYLNTSEFLVYCAFFERAGGGGFKSNGMKFYFNSKERSSHNYPHVHINYKDDDASISLNGDLLAGSLPTRKLKEAKKIIQINKQSLLLQWNRITDGQKFELSNGNLIRVI